MRRSWRFGSTPPTFTRFEGPYDAAESTPKRADANLVNCGRLALLASVIVLIALFFHFGLHDYLRFEFLQSQRMTAAGFYEANPWLAAFVFMAIYIAVTGLSLPGATILTLAAGAVFGLVAGVVMVSFASATGATLAFLLARYLFRDAVQQRFGKLLAPVNRGVDKEGAFYLFALRLVPALPFFAINVSLGLTRIRVWTFYWVSQAGMLAGTFVYVNAGRELGRLDSLAGILSPTLILSFLLLGLFPLLAKKALDGFRLRSRKR